MTYQIGIREAKANLSKHIQSVRQGNEIILTDRGRPVGKIVPIQPEETSLTERLQRLESQGLIGPAPKQPAGQPAPLPLADGLAQRILQEERGNG